MATNAAIRFLIRDRDTTFVGPFDEVFRSAGARVIPTPVRAECTDWTLILGRRHLDRTLRTYAEHYNRGRPIALSRSRHPWRTTRSLWL